MNVILDTTILGEPVGQGRPRAVRMGALGVRMHAPKKSSEWQALAAQQFAKCWPLVDSHGEPVRLVVVAVGPRAKSTPKRLGRGRMWGTAKPDLDNVVKAVADALVQASVLRDDTLVAQIQASKYVAAHGEGPSVRVMLVGVEPLEAVPWPEPARKMTKALAATCARRFRTGESFAVIAADEGIPQEAVEEVVRVAPPPRRKAVVIREKQAARDLEIRFPASK